MHRFKQITTSVYEVTNAANQVVFVCTADDKNAAVRLALQKGGLLPDEKVRRWGGYSGPASELRTELMHHIKKLSKAGHPVRNRLDEEVTRVDTDHFVMDLYDISGDYIVTTIAKHHDRTYPKNSFTLKPRGRLEGEMKAAEIAHLRRRIERLTYAHRPEVLVPPEGHNKLLVSEVNHEDFVVGVFATDSLEGYAGRHRVVVCGSFAAPTPSEAEAAVRDHVRTLLSDTTKEHHPFLIAQWRQVREGSGDGKSAGPEVRTSSA